MMRSTVPCASPPRTPFLLESARIPTFNHIPVWGFFVAGIVVLLLGYLVAAFIVPEKF